MGADAAGQGRARGQEVCDNLDVVEDRQQAVGERDAPRVLADPHGMDLGDGDSQADRSAA